MGIPYIPKEAHRDCVYLHVFYAAGDRHYVTDQTISEIYVGSGTYQLMPPAAYDPAWAFSTKDLAVYDATTNQALVNVYSLEPISGILTLLTAAPYPPSIKVSYRYYAAYFPLKVTSVKQFWPDPPAYPDAYGQQVYPLQDKFPEKISWRYYGPAVNEIKAFIRRGVRQNNFFLIIDDNACDLTWDANRPALLQPGWAAEGPLFSDEIDLVNRGGDVAPTFEMQVHQYGDYYWHSTITPTARWWPDEFGGLWGWDYFKAPDCSSLITPTVPYAWGPGSDDWWEDGSYSHLAFAGIGVDDLTLDFTGYSGRTGRTFHVFISNAGPDRFQWRYQENGVWSAPSAEQALVAAVWVTLPVIGGINEGQGALIRFAAAVGHNVGDAWTWLVQSHAPVGLRALGIPPGGHISWISNLPAP